ncbi:MAG TPA: class I adenylate-forming enzyme family protein [Clostridia bacterium]|jgi:long-chain acyl-CoA synthetase|nr:class I adenylate-forming enzyme family protein [Clostridia bacterium]
MEAVEIKNTDQQMYSLVKNGFSGRLDKVAISYMGNNIKASDFFKEVDLWAEILKNTYGIQNGDVVAMNLPNIPNAIILFYAMNKCGAIANIMHPFLPAKTVVKLMEKTNTKMFFVYDVFFKENEEVLKEGFKGEVITVSVSDYLPTIKKLIYSQKEPKFNKSVSRYAEVLKKHKGLKESFECERQRVTVYMHSAGTSGEPKIVVLSNYALNELSKALTYVIPNRDADHNKCITVMPLFHGFGFGVCMHVMLSHGFEIILIPRFTPKEMVKVTYSRKATICAGVPILFKKLLDLSDKDFKKLFSLEHMFVGGDKLSAELKEEFDTRVENLGGIAELTEGYGLTETVTVCCVNLKGEKENTSMGPPLRGISFKIIDEDENTLPVRTNGEICVAGPTLMDGYLGDEEGSCFIQIDDEKYVKTGDIGFIDEQGKLHFLDRKKRIFKVSGITIFPSEIESTIKKVNTVKDCITIQENRKIIAFVESTNTNIDSLREAILETCKENLIYYAIPKVENIIIVPKFPKTVVGKTNIQELTKLVSKK